MSGTGVNYQDLLPIPEKTNAVDDPYQYEKSHGLNDGETASHALATSATTTEDEYGKGLAQIDHGLEVKDLGWNEPKQVIPSPLVGGMENEELWLLVRRFNKQMYHVKETTSPVPGNLDMNVADEDEFSPDKLRSTVERLYMTVIIGLMGFGKHIVRLRSWKEQRRTTCFCVAYFVAWAFDMVMPLITLFLVVLIAYPPSRDICFPPAPLALVDGHTGGVQKPKAGVLGSHDSATGAPENHKGEAVEAEASNFVNGIAHVALSSASGKHPQNEPSGEDGDPGDRVPDPTAVALSASSARVAAGGNKTDHADGPPAKHDKTKIPMETAIWNKMRPIMHTIADIADGWERFANALSPTPPFPQEGPRFRLAAVIVPLFAMSIFVTSYMYMKGVMFGIGAGFFGDPIVVPAVHYLNTHYPNWQKLLELRNTLLKGIPTNAQLTITLLRVGEANKAPLPPPPYIDAPPPDQHAHIDETHLNSSGGDNALGASDEEIRAAIAHDPTGTTAHETKGIDIDASKEKKHGKKGARVLGFFKTGVKASIETALGADRLKATAGSTPAKNRLGAATRDIKSQVSGPVDFRARYNGKKGHVYISTKATIPCVAFTVDHSVEKIGTQDRDDLHPVWTLAVADIKEIKKIGGFGWKTRLVVGWALDRDVADGMEIVDREGTSWKITAMPLRDELFNRLVAMGGQKWESW